MDKKNTLVLISTKSAGQGYFKENRKFIKKNSPEWSQNFFLAQKLETISSSG